MIIQGITLNGISIYDSSFNSNGALLYVDAGKTASYPGTGTTWTDLSGKANNATLVGNPSFNNSVGYFTFNGTGSQYASTATAKYNSTYTGKTIIVAARMASGVISVGQFRCLFGTNSGSRNFNTYLYSPSSGNYQIHYSANNAGGFSNNLSIVANQWYVFTVTQTTGGLVTYYLNGQAVGTNTGITFAQWVSNGGEYVGLGDNYWYGDISVCAVYGKVLSADELKQNYSTLATRYGL